MRLNVSSEGDTSQRSTRARIEVGTLADASWTVSCIAVTRSSSKARRCAMRNRCNERGACLTSPRACERLIHRVGRYVASAVRRRGQVCAATLAKPLEPRFASVRFKLFVDD